VSSSRLVRFSPIGIKGLGEIGIVGVSTAIANAVFTPPACVCARYRSPSTSSSDPLPIASQVAIGESIPAVVWRVQITNVRSEKSGARDLNPVPHGPEPTSCRVPANPVGALLGPPELDCRRHRVILCPPVSAKFRECVIRL
jgi:hypothetical protein